MISRRLLRIKALLILYAFNRREGDNLDTAENELMQSIQKTYDLYHAILLLLIDVAEVAGEKIEIARQKRMPLFEDLNPNTRFVNNRLLRQLSMNNNLKSYTRNGHITWAGYSELPRKLYNQMLVWEPYVEYMSSTKDSYSEDRKFIVALMTGLVSQSEDLENALEEQSIYWNDDLEFVIMMIEKTFRLFKEESGNDTRLLELFKNVEDEDFVKVLLRKAIIHFEKYTLLIDNHTTNWEIERIALMDKLVMILALTEIVEFDEIPVKVTLNEYIEIAKYYCTSKSGIFVNGILDKVVREMREEKSFIKKGRGLIGEPGFES